MIQPDKARCQQLMRSLLLVYQGQLDKHDSLLFMTAKSSLTKGRDS